MRIAVIGDSICDIEVQGCFNGDCVENEAIALFKGTKVNVHAGGAGNAATILSEAKATVDLWTGGPGEKDKAWISALFQKVVRANRIVWANQGSIPVKFRAVQNGWVVSRMEAEEIVPWKSGFPA